MFFSDSEDDDFKSIYSEHIDSEDDFDTEMEKERDARMGTANNRLER